MPKINTYATKGTPVGADSVLGLDSTDNSVVRFTLTALSSLFGSGGLPTGGSTGQALVKASNDDGDVEWSTISSGGGTTNRFVHIMNSGTATQNFASMPAVDTEWNKRLRRVENFADYTSCRLIAYVVGSGSAGSSFFIEYTTDLSGATGWTALGATLAVDSTSNDAPNIGSTVSIPTGAKTTILIRVMGTGGNGSSSPSFSNMYLELIP